MKEINQDRQVCNCCGGPLSWREINQRCRELGVKEIWFNYIVQQCIGQYQNSYKEYNCDVCVRDKKICEILKED